MFTLKPLQSGAVPEALKKAERYRLLNEPGEAESICLDVLHVDAENHDAIVMLLLTLTDQFEHGTADRMQRALDLLPRLGDAYERAYFHGMILERRAKAIVKRLSTGYGPDAYQWYVNAMAKYEEAEKLSPAHNNDAQLRWNACARKIMDNRELRPRVEERFEPLLE